MEVTRILKYQGGTPTARLFATKIDEIYKGVYMLEVMSNESWVCYIKWIEESGSEGYSRAYVLQTQPGYDRYQGGILRSITVCKYHWKSLPEAKPFTGW